MKLLIWGLECVWQEGNIKLCTMHGQEFFLRHHNLDQSKKSKKSHDSIIKGKG